MAWVQYDAESRNYFWTLRHMWVEFVVGSRLCSKRFSPGTPVFPSPQKPTFLNSSSIWRDVSQLLVLYTKYSDLFIYYNNIII